MERRRRIGNKPPKSQKPRGRCYEPDDDFDFYEDDSTDDNQDTAYRTIQPEVESWIPANHKIPWDDSVLEEEGGDFSWL